MEAKKQRVILFPFMAKGHLTPFILLASHIIHRYPNYNITLVNTPKNIKNIKASLPSDSKINLKSLPFNPSSHGLPAAGENAASLPFHLFVNLFEASGTLQPAFEQLVTDLAEEDGQLPFCIIADYFLAWTVDSARKFRVFHSVFITSSAYGNAIFLSLNLHLPQSHTTSDEFSLPNFPEICIHRSQLTPFLRIADGTDRSSLFFQRQIKFCKISDAMLVNTAKEFETTGLTMLHKLFELPIFPVGPLLSDSNSIDIDLRKWLDSQLKSSVLYISFGSQNTITTTQMMELAKALEVINYPFIWVIRPPVGFDIKGEFKHEWLPRNFEERIGKSEKGILVHQWASQVEILSHPSIGAFLSHCGWNSVLESMINSVPIISWPLAAEQFYNSKFLEEETGVCVEVARGNTENSKVEKQEIVNAIEVVMLDKEMREKAKEIGEILRRAMKEEENGNIGSSIKGLDEFMQLAASK